MNSHEQYAALLDAFIDEALPGTEAERVRAHLAVCPECQAYVSDALTMRELFPGVEETLVPDGFEEAVLSGLPPQNGVTQAKKRRAQARNGQTQARDGQTRTQNGVTQAQSDVLRTQAQSRRAQWQNGQWRTQWTKIALPLAACVTFVLLVGGILRGVPRPGGATENVTLTAAGYDMDEAAPENESDMDEAAPESAEEYGGVMDGAENMSAADMDMGGGAAFGNGMDGGATPDSVTNGGAASGENTNTSGAAFKRTYETPEEPETEESAIFNTGINAPSFYYDSANLPEIPSLGASYDALTDSADAVSPQSAQSDTMPPQSDMIPAYTAESDTVPPRNAETESASDNGDAAPPVTESAPIPEPDENQRVSGEKSAAASADDSAMRAAPDDVSTESAPDDVSMESAPESVGAEESVTVSFWTLSPDAAPAPELSQLLTQRPVSKKTASGVWYALEPEQFDALRENLPESAFTPLDPDSLPPDDAPPLRSRAPVYLFLPFTDSANP